MCLLQFADFVSFHQTNWDNYDSSRRLSDRIDDITRWKEKLKACAQEVNAEMDALTLVNNISN